MNATTPMAVRVARQQEIIDSLKAAIRGLFNHFSDCAMSCDHPECAAYRAAEAALNAAEKEAP